MEIVKATFGSVYELANIMYDCLNINISFIEKNKLTLKDIFAIIDRLNYDADKGTQIVRTIENILKFNEPTDCKTYACLYACILFLEKKPQKFIFFKRNGSFKHVANYDILNNYIHDATNKIFFCEPSKYLELMNYDAFMIL
jgi:hypothetical protein